MRKDWLFSLRLPLRSARLRHAMRVFLPTGATIALAGILVFTVFFTALEWQWIAFLSGVLSAAILAMASRASKSEWRIARRTAQLNQAKERLAREIAEHKQTQERLSQEANARKLAEEALELSRNQLRARKSLKPRAAGEAGTSAPALLARAESSVMQEDGQGLYLASLTENRSGWSNAAERLAGALENDEFRLYHQAILPLKSDQDHPSIHEILIRLQEEEDNMAPPGAFIPIAERYNMMPAIDRWVVRHVIGWHGKNRATPAAPPRVLYSINLAGVTLSDREFPDFIRNECAANNFPPQALCFEIAEGDALARLADASRFISELKPAGCRFALDGFGETNVSFDHLKHVPVDFLKIDGNIIREILRDPVSLAKTKGIQRVCRTIGIQTVGLFVESPEVLDKLRELEVDYVQGFGISRPRPLAEFTEPSVE